MKYDLIIIKIDKTHIKTIAKLLCTDPSISLQKALSMLENLPVTFKQGLSVEEVKAEGAKLSSLGAKVKTIPSKEPQDLLGTVQFKGEKSIDSEPDTMFKKSLKREVSKLPDERRTKKKRTENIPRTVIPSKKKKSSFAPMAILLFFLLLMILAISQGIKKPEYKIKNGSTVISKKSDSKEDGKVRGEKKDKKNRQMKLNIFSSMKEKKEKEKVRKIKESDNYSDSADLFHSDPDEMVRFYKIAISINKYNFNAWSGLVNAYADLGMTREAFQAREEMKKLFSEEMFSVEQIVRPYGKLTTFKQEGDLCRLEYKSRSKKRVKIESEVYTLLKNLKSSLGCSSYSVYAATGKGRGMLLRLEGEKLPATFSKFLVKAQVNFIE